MPEGEPSLSQICAALKALAQEVGSSVSKESALGGGMYLAEIMVLCFHGSYRKTLSLHIN